MVENTPEGDMLLRHSSLRIVKLTPIALSVCNSCKTEFTSHAPVEDDAEAEMKIAFDTHRCCG